MTDNDLNFLIAVLASSMIAFLIVKIGRAFMGERQ